MTAGLSPDGKTLALGDWHNPEIWIWDLSTDTPKQIKTLSRHRFAVNRLEFTPDGRYLISAGDELVIVWDAKTLQYVTTLLGHYDQLWGMAITPDSRRILSVSSREFPGLKIWDVSKAASQQPLPGTLIGLAGKGHDLVTAEFGGSLKVWKDGKASLIAQIENPADTVSHSYGTPAATVTQDGTTLVHGFVDGSLRAWEIDTGDILWEAVVSPGDYITVVYPDPQSDSTLVIGTRTGRVLFWDWRKQTLIRELEHLPREVHRLSMSPDGSKLAVVRAMTCRFYSVPADKELFSYERNTSLWAPPEFSRDGRRVAISYGAVIELLNSETWEQLAELRGHGMAVFSMAFSPDGNSLISASESVRIWHLPTQTDIVKLPGAQNVRLVSDEGRHELFISRGILDSSIERIEVKRLLVD